jgi:hypothetical protein
VVVVVVVVLLLLLLLLLLSFPSLRFSFQILKLAKANGMLPHSPCARAA